MVLFRIRKHRNLFRFRFGDEKLHTCSTHFPLARNIEAENRRAYLFSLNRWWEKEEAAWIGKVNLPRGLLTHSFQWPLYTISRAMKYELCRMPFLRALVWSLNRLLVCTQYLLPLVSRPSIEWFISIQKRKAFSCRSCYKATPQVRLCCCYILCILDVVSCWPKTWSARDR